VRWFRRRTRRALPVALATLVVGALAVVAPPPVAQAADGVENTAATTYELVPAKGILTVTIDVTVTNRVPGGSRLVPCTKWGFDPSTGYYPIQGTCRQTVDYYLDGSYLVLERGARNIRMTANRGSVSRTVDRTTDAFIGYKLTYAALYSGQTRKIHITYELPGGKPRSATATRIGQAYTNFCVVANGLDSGSVRVVVPDVFDMAVFPVRMQPTASGSSLVYESGTIVDTSWFYRCFEGTNEAGFARSEVTSPTRRTVVVEGWPEDGAWRAAVGAEVGSAVAGLEKLVGRGLPGRGPITIREVSSTELGNYAGIFDPETGVARISETYAEPGVVAHELSHAWFNFDFFGARWMSEGLAQWAERVSPTAGPPCGEPGAYPGTGAIDLDEWTFLGPKSTAAERELVDYEYQASCWIATSLASAMGEEQMSAVIAALLDRRAAYGDKPTDRRPGNGPVDWKTFLDLVDEVGLVPVGETDLEYAQDLLLRYGVADRGLLAGRAEARAAYHALARDLGAWQMPEAIRARLELWDFATALKRTATAEEVLALVHEADAALAGIDAAAGPAKAAFEDARTVSDLADARALAATQAAAAKDVAGALAALDEPRDTIEEIGLMGVELQPVADRALAAAKAADAAAAGAAATEIRDRLGRASETGVQRVALAAGGVLLALLGLVGAIVLVRRRRHRRPAAAEAAGWTTDDSLGPDLAVVADGDPDTVYQAEATALGSDPDTATPVQLPDDLIV